MSDYDSQRLISRCAKSVALLLTALALHGVVALAQAQTHKCVGQDGRTTYSSLPCAASDQAKTLDIRGNAPPPTPEEKAAAEAAKRRQATEAYEAKEAARQARQDAGDRAVAATAARVRQIKAENYDPKKCAAARGKAAAIQRRDPLMAPLNVNYFDMKQKAELYCGP